MPTIYTIIVYWSWAVLFLAWVPGYFTAKKTIKRPNPVSRVIAFILIFGGFGFLFSDRGHEILQLTPQNTAFGLAGLVIDLIFVAFAIWARITIGRNWSNAITLKEGHELVKTGPYAVVRHPIYTGMFFAALGAALTIGSLFAYVGAICLLAGMLIRIHDEDALMAQQFPQEHAAYRAQTKTFIPFIW
jgi:protein-S-isoprenylcysteine O-methyltransferase Ste14